MKLKKLVAMSTAVVIASSMLVGCSNKSPEENKSGNKNLKIGMVADVGGVNDESFNQSAWEGLQQAKEDFGIEVKLIESKQASEYLTNMESLLDEDVDLVIGVGNTMKDDIKKEAENYPDKQFAIIDETYEDGIPENVTPILFKSNEAAYLTGLIAGKSTKTNKVGFIGGMQFPVIEKFEYGYMAGVKEANSAAEVKSQYAGTFGDAAKGKSIANQMYVNGVDIILSAAGGTGLGAIESAKEQDKYAIGVDRDQSSLAPENILTSALKRVNVGVYDTVKDFVEGKSIGGKEKIYGLKEDGVGIPESTKNLVSPEILDYVNTMIEKIKKDEIKVPSNEQEYKQMNK
ncbi:BMP family lipoprotein [Romboutsia sp.]|uniref:BMP family lipoprotein n=1 Tax=Romboutsia sp. TaxID=1965302 RepID=UPI003F38B454